MTAQRALRERAGELEGTLEELTTIYQSMFGTSAADFEKGISTLLRMIIRKMEARSVFLYLWDEEVEEFLPVKIEARAGDISSLRQPIRELIRRAAQDHQATELKDLSADPQLAALRGIAQSALLMPLQVGGDMVGMLGILDADRQLARRHLKYLAFVSSFMLAAVRHNRRLQEMSRQNAELSRMKGRLEAVLGELERRQAMIEAIEARFASILDIAADAIIIVDEEQRIVLFNKGAEQIFGYRSDEVLGQPLDLLLPPRFVEAHRQHIRDFAAAPDAARRVGERRMIFGRRKDGTEFPAEASISKLSQNGQTNFTAILRDVTERKRAEEVILESNRRLERALAELKAAQQQIVQQERLSALGEMASGIAHDFNNALLPILGFSELPLMRPENLDDKEKVIDYLQIINTAAKDAAKVIGRLREFYRYRKEIEVFQPVNLNQLVEQVVSLTQPKWKDQALANGITITIIDLCKKIRHK